MSLSKPAVFSSGSGLCSERTFLFPRVSLSVVLYFEIKNNLYKWINGHFICNIMVLCNVI